MTQQKRIDEITIARAIAIFGVFFVHCTSTAVTTLAHDSSMYGIYNFFSTFGRLGTPTFIMLSAFILFYSYYNREVNSTLIKNFYSKRLKFIVLPYLTFSLFYFLVKWNINGLGALSPQDLIERFVFLITYGKAHPHLYFVIISIQFYILFPFLLLALKKIKWLRYLAIPIGIAVQVVWIYVNRHYLQVDYKGSVVLTYSAFYMLGAFGGIYYNQIKELVKTSKRFKYSLFAFATTGMLAFLAAYTFYNYRVRTSTWKDIMEAVPFLSANNSFELFWAGYTMFASIVILIVANYINKSNGLIKSFFMKIGVVSFGMYLIHPYYLLLLRDEFAGMTNGMQFHIAQLSVFILVFVLSYITVYVIQKFVPFNWIIFGKSEIKGRK